MTSKHINRTLAVNTKVQNVTLGQFIEGILPTLLTFAEAAHSVHGPQAAEEVWQVAEALEALAGG